MALRRALLSSYLDIAYWNYSKLLLYETISYVDR